MAPMGEIGLKLFQQFMERGANAAMGGFGSAGSPKKPKASED